MKSAQALPKRHPRRIFESKWVQLAAVVLAPFVVTCLLLWGLLGFAFTLPPIVVAGASTGVTWTLYLCLPGIPVNLIDWPLAFTAGYALMAFSSANQATFQFTIWVVLMTYAIVRAVLYNAFNEEDATTHQIIVALAVLGSALPLWLTICRTRLWVPADEKLLEEVEHKIYKKYIATGFDAHLVAGLGTVHVPYCGDSSRLPPRTLVLVHGYMAGNAFWAANLQTLAKFFNVYAVEWKGIGRSIRPAFKPKTDKEMDDFFVESLEDWRRAMQLDRFVMCGHSMGGMYATYYTEKYAQHVEHLILVSPAGVHSSGIKTEELSWIVRLLGKYYITPMSAIRYAGPFGLSMVQFLLKKRIQWTPETNIIRSGDMDFDDISAYCYHNWALKASGDRALYTHLHPGAMARHRPLSEVLVPNRLQVPLTIMYGGGSDWMPSEFGEAVVRRLEKTQYAVFRLVPLAGHQVFMDNPSDFNQMVIDAVLDHERAVANGTAATNYYH